MKSRILLSIASAVALCTAAPAMAAGGSSDAGMQSESGSASGSAEFSAAKPDQFKASSLVGKEVESTSGEPIGEIAAVIVDKEGTARGVVVEAGSYLGMGERNVAIAWDQLQFADSGQRIRVDATKEQLEAMPTYDMSGQPGGEDGLYTEPGNYFERTQQVPLPE